MRLRSFAPVFLTLIFVSSFFLFTPDKALGETASKQHNLPKTSLIGTVHLDPDVVAERYKVKLKKSGKVKYEQTVPSFSPFQFTPIEPGTYDLVIEANGHTTLVKPRFILINGQNVVRIDVKVEKALTIFQAGDATKIILCSACHKKIYMEMIRGEGIDFHTSPWPGPDGDLIHLPDLARDFYENSSPEHLAYVSPITVASILKQPEEKRDACRRCHAPTRILQGGKNPVSPSLREKNRIDGVSCASCHLDRDGNVHGKHDLSAPHPTVQNPLFTRARSAELCAACHQNDAAAPAQQTYLEWQSDFAPKDDRTCQDCHMPRTTRLLSEIFSDRPKRLIGKHLFAGGHAPSMLKKAANLSVEQDRSNTKIIHIGITNNGAGHSLPTGYGPRAILLHAKVMAPDGTVFLDSKEKEPLAIYTVNPDLAPVGKNIHPAIRAGTTEKVALKLGEPKGLYRIEVKLFYDLDHLVAYNDNNLPVIASLDVEVDTRPTPLQR